MSLICELYYEVTEQERLSDEQVITDARNKIEKYKKLAITIADFGTRRRHSYQVHQLVVETLKNMAPVPSSEQVTYTLLCNIKLNQSARMRMNGLCFMLLNMDSKWQIY